MDHFCPPVVSHSIPMASGAILRQEDPKEVVKRLWNLESIGISDPLDPDDDELAISLFKDSVLI